MQSNKQFNSPFYQNKTNIQNLTNSELDDLYSTVYDSLGEAIENDDLELHDEILPVLRAIKTEIQNRNKVTPENEIQTIDNQIQVTQTQINRFNKLNSFATFLQKKSNKKSFYKYRQILLSIRNKIDLKQRVLNLLAWEKERLINFA
ncbi:MAG: hypothetical protein PHG81_11905 [Aliarcobacter sp.]|nr:hypothetical protein [Aliarcobacter sp.]